MAHFRACVQGKVSSACGAVGCVEHQGLMFSASMNSVKANSQPSNWNAWSGGKMKASEHGTPVAAHALLQSCRASQKSVMGHCVPRGFGRGESPW